MFYVVKMLSRLLKSAKKKWYFKLLKSILAMLTNDEDHDHDIVSH